ncbi:MAG: hypothetical protein RJQ09_20430 [Cyclobacteriaceae bacterium]
MALLSDLAIAVLGGIFTALVIYGYNKLKGILVLRRINKTMPIARGVGIFISSHQSTLNEKSETKRTLVTAESVQGITKLLMLYSRFNVEPVMAVDKYYQSDGVFGVEICLGAPDANTRTKYYIETYLQALKEEYTNIKNVVPNYARIIKITCYRSPSKTPDNRIVVFLIFGHYTFDTVSAMCYFSENFDLIQSNLNKEYCNILLRTSFELGISNAQVMSW